MHRRRKALLLPYALVALSIGLAGCRDGGGADAPSGTGTAASAASSAATSRAATAPANPTYAIARVATADAADAAPGSRATRSTLYIVEAAAGSALQAIDLGVSSGATSPPANVSTTQDIRRDRTTGRHTYNGESVAFFVKDGKAWKIELRSGLPHVPVQVSSLATACRIAFDLSALPVSADGRDAWVKVDTAGPGGNCALGATGAVFVRSTMSSATAPLASLPGVYVDALDDGARGTLAFAMLTPAGLELYRPDFSRIGKVDGGEGARVAQFLGYDFANPQASFYRVDGTLRRMTWTAAAATLAAPTYTFARPDFGTRNPVAHADLRSLYFADDQKVMKISGAGQPAEVVTVTGPPIYAIFGSDTHLVMWQADPANPRAPNAASVVAKAGGTVVTVSKASAMGTTARKMLYLSGNLMHAVDFDGSQDTVLGDGPGLGTVVGNRSWVADLHYIDAHVACVPGASADRKCSNGRLVQTQIDSLERIDIGAVAHAATYATAFFGYGGRTLGMLFPAATGIPTFAGYQAFPQRGGGNVTDLYAWTPGTADSLVRLTKELP